MFRHARLGLRPRLRALLVASAALVLASAAPARADDDAVQRDRVQCSLGVGLACVRMGERALAGDGVDASPNLAAVYFREACEQAAPPIWEACARLGELYQQGKGVERSVAEARRYLKAGCVNHVAGACLKLDALDGPAAATSDVDAWCDPGDAGCGPPQSKRDRDAQRFASGCNADAAEDCARLGVLLLQPGPDRDPERAARVLDRACTAGKGDACASLGWLYLRGDGVGKDVAHARELYDRACEVGHAHGCAMEADLYATGTGVEKDLDAALDLARRACDGGCKDGCGIAGFLLVSPDYPGRDLERGLDLLDQACRGGDARACGIQGYLIVSGRVGARSDRRKGLDLLRRSCEGESPIGCYTLGVTLTGHAPVAAEREEAYAAFDKACKLHHAESCGRRDALKRN